MPTAAAARNSGKLPPLPGKGEVGTATVKDPIAELKDLKAQFDRGEISKSAFESRKKKLLDQFAKGSSSSV